MRLVADRSALSYYLKLLVEAGEGSGDDAAAVRERLADLGPKPETLAAADADGAA